MIITFCGHSDFSKSKEYENAVMDFFETRVNGDSVDFFLGGYGKFDAFAYNCAKNYKVKHPNASLVFVTPYMSLEYQENHLKYQETRYDEIIYPDIEGVYPKFAIPYRNRWMVEKADLIVAFVNREYGGAYHTFKHAKRKGKYIFNLADIKTPD